MPYGAGTEGVQRDRSRSPPVAGRGGRAAPVTKPRERASSRLDRARSQGGHDARIPCGYRGFSASSVGGRCLAWSHEHHGPRRSTRSATSTPALCSSSPATTNESSANASSCKLQLAAHWADLHPATAGHRCRDARWGGAPGRRVLGGDGTPAVAAFTPEPFALALGMSPSAGAQLIADALDLRHRLPILWKRVVGWRCRPGRPAGSPARPTASPRPPRSGSTNSSPTAAPAARSSSTGFVAQAIAAYDPETHEDRENDAQAGWDVTLTHPDPTDFLGTSHLEATGDTLTLKAFYDQVCARRPPAVPRRRHRARSASARSRPSASSPANPRPPATPKVKVYVRVEARDLEPDALAVGEIEKLGAATLTKIRDWVGHHQVVIQPVLNMARRDAVDSHDPPPWMRDLVHPPRRPLHLPQMPGRRQVLRPRPHRSPTTRTDHPAKPGPTTSPPCAGDTTAPRPPAAGEYLPHARRRLPLARPVRHDATSSPPAAPNGSDHAESLSLHRGRGSPLEPRPKDAMALSTAGPPRHTSVSAPLLSPSWPRVERRLWPGVTSRRSSGGHEDERMAGPTSSPPAGPYSSGLGTLKRPLISRGSRDGIAACPRSA